MAEQTIAGDDNTFSLRPNRPGGCYKTQVEMAQLWQGEISDTFGELR